MTGATQSKQGAGDRNILAKNTELRLYHKRSTSHHNLRFTVYEVHHEMNLRLTMTQGELF